MNERAARDVTLARVIEATDVERAIWSDAERMAASRSAAETVGAAASDDAYLAARAARVLERVAKRHPQVEKFARMPLPRTFLLPLVVLVAFAVGAIGADVGPANRINLLAPPVLALLAWNVGVYAMLLVAPLAGRRGSPGPLRRNVVAWLRDSARPLRRAAALPAPLAAAVARFAVEWPVLAAPLWQRRAAMLLHVGAAALAGGAIAGLYVRGIALEYRAAWQSTFLDAADVARILDVVLAPGAWLTAIAVPDAAHLAAVGPGSPGENAASWIHLYAGTIVLVVVVPRLALAAWSWVRERSLTLRFPVALDQPYYRRLLAAWRGGTARVAAIAYSFAVPQARMDALSSILTRAFDAPVDVTWLRPVPYGSDDVPDLPGPPLAAVCCVFTLNATPERDNHAAFARAVEMRLAGSAPLVAILDTSDFADRFAAVSQRIAERQTAWQQALAAEGIDAVFVRLAAPDVRATAEALAGHLEREAA